MPKEPITTNPFTAFVPTHAWCIECDKVVTFKVSETSALDFSGRFNSRDMTCENGHVVTTLYEAVQ